MTSGVEAVTVERSGPVTTVRLSRPHVRNAVDGPTAAALADAFRAFDADDSAAVAVLHGEGGAFCAGADLCKDHPSPHASQARRGPLKGGRPPGCGSRSR